MARRAMRKWPRLECSKGLACMYVYIIIKNINIINISYQGKCKEGVHTKD